MNVQMKAETSTAQTVVLPIEGMTCASCVARVERALQAVPGVSQAHVNLATEKAEVRFSDPVTYDLLVRTVENTGYGVPLANTELSIEGMTCASCVGRVERALAGLKGVRSAHVNLATERATVEGTASPEDLVKAVENAGYDAALIGDTGAAEAEASARKDAERAGLKRDLWVAGILTLPVFLLEMGSHLIPAVHHLVMQTVGTQTSWYFQFALTTLVLFFPGLLFYQKGFPALFRLAPDMNSMVAVGTMAAYAYSVVATFLPSLLPAGTVNVYYEAASVIVTLILLGRYLEAKAKGKTSEAIKRLVQLQARTAR